MNELGSTIEAMDSAQLVAAFAFVAGYVLALGRLATPRGRRWAAAVAALAAAAFVALTRPWTHGALLVALAVVGIAVFIALAWAVTLGLARWRAAHAAPRAAAADRDGSPAASEAQPATAPDAAASAPPAGARRRHLSAL